MHAIIKKGSPLNRLGVLNAEQRGYLEGVRHSIDLADLSMRRLHAALDQLSTVAIAGGTDRGEVPAEIYTAAMADAWGFVDATWRLRNFINDRHVPLGGHPSFGASRNQAGRVDARSFLKAAKVLRELRDGFQHLDNFASKQAMSGNPIWGYLTWIATTPNPRRVETCVLVTGTHGPGKVFFKVVNPSGLEIRGPFDHVTINAFSMEANLSGLHREIATFTANLEGVIGPQLPPDEPKRLPALLIRMTFGFDDEPTTSN